MKDIANPRVIVDFDKPGSPLPEGTLRCDYLVIADGQKTFSWVAPLELKRGQLQASEVVRQLQAGASAAEKLVSKDETVRFRPVAVSGSVTKHQREKLRHRIRFHEHSEAVRLMRCGDQLAKTLK